MPIRHLAAALLALAALASSSPAITRVFDLAPAAAVQIDARNADTPPSASEPEPTLKLVLNRSSDGETPDTNDQSRLLFALPPEIFDAPTSRVVRALLTLSSTYSKNYDARPLRLHPLAAPFSPSAATWNARDAETPWTTPGGDFLPNVSVSAVYDSDSATVAFDIAPLLADTNAAAALRANGAIVCFDAETPMAAEYMQLTFASPAYDGDSALRPSLRYALADPFSDVRDFALSHIDSRDTDTVFWEQWNFGESTVGKVILNGSDGSECRAILTLPETLAETPPQLVQSVVAHFDAEIQDWKGEAVFLAPLATKTSLERRTNDGPMPDHGPSWTYADGPVDAGDATLEKTPWKLPGGDWMPGSVVRGTVTAPVKGTAGTADFDLTALWRDDAARAALLANGAIVFMDPAAFPQVKAAARMARVNLYRPDDDVVATRFKYSWFRITECERLADDSGAPESVATTYIDSASPGENFSTANKTLVTLNNAARGTESRALLQLPPSLLDVDLLAVGSVNLLVSYYRSWPVGGVVNPIALHPAATPFRLDQATWNKADDDTDWNTPGSDFLDAFVTASDTPAQSMLAFDLAPLLADPAAAAALAANGAVVRMLGDPPQADSNNGYNLNGSRTDVPPVIVLVPADLEIRAIGIDVESGKLTLFVVGLEPLRPCELQACSDLAAEEGTENSWRKVAPVPDSGIVTLDLPDALPFYRVHLAD